MVTTFKNKRTITCARFTWGSWVLAEYWSTVICPCDRPWLSWPSFLALFLLSRLECVVYSWSDLFPCVMPQLISINGRIKDLLWRDSRLNSQFILGFFVINVWFGLRPGPDIKEATISQKNYEAIPPSWKKVPARGRFGTFLFWRPEKTRQSIRNLCINRHICFSKFELDLVLAGVAERNFYFPNAIFVWCISN